MYRIVSVTPLKVAADSRTYKMAATFARLGYDSIVYEGLRSDLDKVDLPFALIHPPCECCGANSHETGTCPARALPREISPAPHGPRAAAAPPRPEINRDHAIAPKAGERIVRPHTQADATSIEVEGAQVCTVSPIASPVVSSLVKESRVEPWPVERALGRLPIGLRRRLRALVPVLLPLVRALDRWVCTTRRLANAAKRQLVNGIDISRLLARTLAAWIRYHLTWTQCVARARSFVAAVPITVAEWCNWTQGALHATWALFRQTIARALRCARALPLILMMRLRMFVLSIANALGLLVWFNRWRFARNHLVKYGVVPFRTLPRANLYYLHGPYHFPAVWFACLRYRSRFIYDAHDFYPIVDPHPFYRFLESWCVRKALAVVTVSNGVARMHDESFGSDPLIIRNCHDDRMDRALDVSLRQSLKLRNTDFLLVSIGHGGKDGQATPQAVESLVGLPDHVHLAFVGDHHEDSQKTIDRLGLQNRAHVVSAVPPTEIVPFVRSADLSLILYSPVNPDYEHALPNKFFQSIAADLPILYSPALPEINALAVRHELGLPIDPQSPSSIREGVRKMMDLDRLSNAKRRAALAHRVLNWEAEEQSLADLIDRISGTRRMSSKVPSVIDEPSRGIASLGGMSTSTALFRATEATAKLRRRA